MCWTWFSVTCAHDILSWLEPRKQSVETAPRTNRWSEQSVAQRPATPDKTVDQKSKGFSKMSGKATAQSYGNFPTGTPARLLGVYCPHEEGICCNNRTRLIPGASSGPVRRFRLWLNLAILRQRPTAASAGGGSAPSMPRMRPGTSASSSRARKEVRLRRSALRTCP